jgi:hypothetical protein
MRWTITLHCSREDGTTSVAEVATIERGRCSTAGDVGLPLVEAKRVNARLQELVMTEQLLRMGTFLMSFDRMRNDFLTSTIRGCKRHLISVSE